VERGGAWWSVVERKKNYCEQYQKYFSVCQELIIEQRVYYLNLLFSF
jgi:hypothetical protein